MRRIKKYKYCLIIILVGLFDIVLGLHIYNKKMNFINTAGKTEGVIYTISKNRKNTLLYVNYYINSKKFDGIIVTEKKNIKISDNILIYYDRKNPTKISDGNVEHNEYILFFLGVMSIFLSLFLILSNHKKQIEKEK